jgi:hypothetical protein
MRIKRLAFLGCLFLTFLIGLAAAPPREENELASYAQDLFRQAGKNIPRSAFSFIKGDGDERIFRYRMLSRQSSLGDELLQAFQIAGALSQHAVKPFDQVVVIAELEFSRHKPMVLWASGDCCEKLYNNRLNPDVFTEGCLRIEE